MKFTKATIITSIAACALVACSDSSTEEAVSTSPEVPPATTVVEELPMKYVALGDSYASMGTKDNVDPAESFCMRSVDNYPAQLAQLLGTEVTDVSCQGGVAQDVTSPRSTPDGQLPPQADALTTDTTLVTVTMGGNDIGFGNLAACASNPNACSAELIAQTNAKLEALPAKLGDMYAAIKEKAPHAQIITTGYLPLIADGDSCDFLAPLHVETREWFVRATTAVNESVEKAATDAGATFILPADASEHSACAPAQQQWTTFTGADTGAYPMHPTPNGQQSIAEAIFAAVGNEQP